MNGKIIFYILGLIIFVFSVFVGGKFPFLLFFLISLIIIFSIFSKYHITKNLSGLFWCTKNNIVRGDKLTLEYKINNGGILPIPYAEIQHDIDEKLALIDENSQMFFIKAFDYITIKKEFRSIHRGKYDVGKIIVKIEDIFGLTSYKVIIEDSLNIVVYPKVYKFKNINLLGNEFFGTNKTNEKHNEDYSNIKNLREYKRGDSLKRIHWKTTARKGEIFVKNYNTSAKLNVKVFMDFQKDKYTNTDKLIEDKIVELTVSIIYFTLYRNIETELITYGNKRINIKRNNISFFNDFLESMVEIRPKSNRKLSDVIFEERSLSSIGNTVILVTIDLDRYLVNSIYSIKKMGVNVTLFIIKINYDKEIKRKIISLEKLGVKVYKFHDTDNIEKALG